MAKVKLGFYGLTVPEQSLRLIHIIKEMTGNVNFPNPSPTLAVMLQAARDLSKAYEMSRNRDKEQVAIMNLRRAELLELVRQLGAYVQMASMGDVEKILSSGFGVAELPAARPPVAQVQKIRVRQWSSLGSLRAIWGKVTAAEAYEVQLSDSGPEDKFFKHYITVIGSRLTIKDLVPGKIYWVRVRAVGRRGAGLWSNVSVQTASI
ncbi:MAG: fibronectin type III domain-containing protein [Bacteroidetes bacterium]|nr:fibronectin type III domain-containing protein [Bacteroidota bacterium]